MSAPALSAAITRDVFLYPAMDARALNVDQDRMIFNPSTPEVDSIFEHLEVLGDRGQVPGSSLRGLVAISVELAESNRTEGSFELAIAGAADQLAHDLRDSERGRDSRNGRYSGGSSPSLSAKAIARRLRIPLRDIAQPAGLPAGRLVQSCRIVSELIAEVPRLQLLSPAVRDQLGKAKYELLAELVEAKNKIGAAQLGTAGAAARRSSHGRF